MSAEVGVLDRPGVQPRECGILGALNAVLAATDRAPIRFPTRATDRFRGSKTFLVSEDELIGLFPSPSARLVQAPRPVTGSAEVLPFGRTDWGAVVGPPIEPDQGRHAAIVGETGMGKSSLLIALAERSARIGGVVLLDPFGETAHELDVALRPSCGDRILRIFAAEGTASLNVLEGLAPDGRRHWLASERRVFDLVHALKRVRAGRYGENGFWGPRLEEVLTRALQVTSAVPGATLTDAHTLLATGGRARLEVPTEALAAVRELGERIRSRPDDAEGARRLLYEVVRSQLLSRLLCDPEPSLHPAELVAPGRITIVSGDASEVGETNARYLLSVYLALIWSQLIGRRTPGKTFVVLDEAQWFANESLAEMLALGRRRNVHVLLATQSVSSLPKEVGDAVWTNVADLVMFRGSPEAAKELERVSRTIAPTTVFGLPRGRAVALIGKGNATFLVRTARTIGLASNPPGRADASPGSFPGTRTPGAPTAVPPAPEQTERGRGWSDPEGPVLAHLRDLANLHSGDSPFRVYLDELRASADPAGAAVRSVGRRLSRAGAIERIARDERGSFWTVRSDRLPPSEASQATPAAADRAGAWKPS